MPNSKKGTKGDLKVKFNILFPDFTSGDRDQLISILQRYPTSSYK